MSGFSSVGRASASQAEGRGFETRNPLQFSGVPVMKQVLFAKIISSPVGDLLLVASENFLKQITFLKHKKDVSLNGFVENRNLPILEKTQQQLEEYFIGKRRTFEIPLLLKGSEFEIKVWRELQKIPFGETISYQELATRVKNKNYARAVGNANGKNPIPIIIPCHRVIQKNGNLGGFGGGLEIKKYLLKLEQIHR